MIGMLPELENDDYDQASRNRKIEYKFEKNVLKRIN